jgi:hypothetical protein
MSTDWFSQYLNANPQNAGSQINRGAPAQAPNIPLAQNFGQAGGYGNDAAHRLALGMGTRNMGVPSSNMTNRYLTPERLAAYQFTMQPNAVQQPWAGMANPMISGGQLMPQNQAQGAFPQIPGLEQYLASLTANFGMGGGALRSSGGLFSQY